MSTTNPANVNAPQNTAPEPDPLDWRSIMAPAIGVPTNNPIPDENSVIPRLVPSFERSGQRKTTVDGSIACKDPLVRP